MAIGPLHRYAPALRTAAAVAGFLLVWELIVRLAGIKAYILPPPSEILTEIWNRQGRYLVAADYTLRPMLLGFVERLSLVLVSPWP
jgi:ABC-type nitrate/sulfonate/bicarbonate transport system permease component